MELVNSPMKERQKLFRQNYRERLAGWYHGWVHLVIIYATGFTALYIYLANVDRVQWWELAAWPIGFLAYQLGGKGVLTAEERERIRARAKSSAAHSSSATEASPSRPARPVSW